MRSTRSHLVVKVLRLALAVALTVVVCMPHIPAAQHAFAATTGTAEPMVYVAYGEGADVLGSWNENVLTVDGEWAYCVQVDDHFEPGLSVSAVDPVATGIWSQELCTRLALIDQLAWSGDLVSTSNAGWPGHKVTSSAEKYAIAQCYIWKALDDAGFSDYGWFSVSVDGVALTGTDTDAQIREYIDENMNLYVGHASYYDCGNYQDVACSFSLEPATGFLELTKASADEKFVAGNGEYSLEGATYGVYQDESCEGDAVAQLVTDDQGHAISEAIQRGDYYVRETKASPGYELDETIYPVTVQPGETVLVNAEKGNVEEVPQTGAISLSKGSALNDITSGNGCYSREGASYDVYSDAACTTRLADMSTGKQGSATAEGLPLGTVYVKEATAPKGMALDETVYPVVVSAGETSYVGGSGGVLDIPKSNPVSLLAAKYDDQKGCSVDGNMPQGAATLENAEFIVEYYDGYYDSAQDAQQQGHLQRTWVMASDSQGLVKLDEAHLLKGDALYRNSEGNPCLPLGTYVIWESKPPVGYMPDSTVHCVQVVDDGGVVESVETYAAPEVANSVKRGDLELVKVGGTDMRRLAGVPFRITSMTTGESHVIVTDANGYASTASAWNLHSANTNANDQVEWEPPLAIAAEDETTTTDEAKRGSSMSETPAEGTPDASEIPAETPENERVESGDPAVRSVEYEAETESVTIPEDVPTSESALDEAESTDDSVTVSEQTEEPEAAENVSDAIASEATEDTSQDARKRDAEPHTESEPMDEAPETEEDETRSLDNQTETVEEEPVMAAKNATDDGMQDATPFDPDAGVWFGLGDDGTTSIPVDDQRGALPYDTYTVEELACPANEGLQLLEVSVVISKDNHVVDLGTLDDPQASIGTAARDGEDGDSVMPCSEEAVIVDKVNYANLIPGREYTMRGRLMDKDGAPLTDDAGNEIVSETTFVPEAQTGYVELSFSLSTLQMEGASIVAFEQLIADGRLVASHEDLEDTDQSVSVAEPSVGTSASDTSDGDGVVTRSSQVSITDRVSYSGLNPGNSYVVEGTLMDKASGAPLVVNGEDVTSHLDFVPESSSGVVEMTFEFDAMNLEDTSQLVVFERLLEQDRLIASHEDLQDMGQTVVVAEPSVHTTLSDSVDEDKTAGMSGVLHLVDNVSYNGLVPGKEYVLKGTLMDKESGEPAVDANGNAIIAETTFTPETEHGSTEVVFEFDGGNLGGHSVVAFEELQEEGRKVAAHADLDDESQTVTITKPSIATQACNATTGERTLETNAIAKVTDRVHITGVVPGNEYTVVGLLMDKKTGLPLAVTQTTGKAGATSNAATDSARMAKLWNEMLALADFSAPNPNQDGSIELDAARSLDYRAIGKMLEEHSNEFDHMVMQVGVVKPKSSSIDVNMGFEFSTENVTGQVVVFEALLESGTGKLLAVHADFGDSEQTLEVPAPPKPAEHTREANAGTYDSTGNMLTRFGWVFALIAALGCASGAYGIAQWRRNLS